MAASDYVQIQVGEGGEIITRASITVWPPPEVIWLVFPVIEPRAIWLGLEEDLPTIALFYDDEGVECCVTEFERVSYSKIPDEVDSPHVARGGLFFPVSP